MNTYKNKSRKKIKGHWTLKIPYEAYYEFKRDDIGNCFFFNVENGVFNVSAKGPASKYIGYYIAQDEKGTPIDQILIDYIKGK